MLFRRLFKKKLQYLVIMNSVEFINKDQSIPANVIGKHSIGKMTPTAQAKISRCGLILQPSL